MSFQGLEDDASGPEKLVHSQNPSKGKPILCGVWLSPLVLRKVLNFPIFRAGLQKQQQGGVRNDANGMKP